ncbi:MAG: molybdopterin-dependent oxidoreductase [Alphaproteobacteria bacterium]|jgi:CO/xanthine dehydrogenase Mo-binding subunit|nr:molybdopterin-dependent oxidoreductase [Alphaproteobacteria bacterium]MDP6589093.1 molybdopterin-dependent oxidoreductase [Alphaproteobacteria bacterium]MDP6819116.1 molybdopterin-dependent oxidoreductase [Alphaproteobacteria bacterium]
MKAKAEMDGIGGGGHAVGQPIKQRELDSHVKGQTLYYEDVKVPRMLHLKIHRSPVAHARILNIDTSKAEQSDGVVAVLTYRDVPATKVWSHFEAIGAAPGAEPILAVDKIRWKGEPIAAVAAETLSQAEDAAAKIKVTYEKLPSVFDVDEALAPGAPELFDCWPGNHYVFPDDHKAAQIRFGDVEKGFAEADHLVEHVYRTRPIEQAPIETAGCVAVPGSDGRYTIYTNSQALSTTRNSAAEIAGLPVARLRLVGGTAGGGFGGKVDMAIEPMALLAAMKSKRPVKYRFTREDEMTVSSTRAAWRVSIKDGVMRDGRITARHVITHQDIGAYLRNSIYGAFKHASHMPGPYTVPNVWADVYCVFTNRTPSAAMRGFGVMPASFAIEMQMDRVAKAIHMDPWQFRLKNAFRNGDMKAHRREVWDAALVETIQAAARLTAKDLPEEYRQMSSAKRPLSAPRIAGG